MDDSFVKAPVAVPKLSGFDKSHQNLLTSKVGTITPILVDELIPGTKVNLKLALSASLPPLATDTFMRCSIKTEAFFVPTRLLDGGFEAWFTDEAKDMVNDASEDGTIDTSSKRAFMPVIRDNVPLTSGLADWVLAKTGTGSLSDYLGVKYTNPNFFKKGISALPYLAYHRIYNDWYRNSLVQKECFLPPCDGIDFSLAGACCSPYVFHNNGNYVWSTLAPFALADGHCLLDLRQRNFGLDYFTTATPNPQQGNAMVVSFDTSGNNGQFSIAALRAANSMQQFKERNNLLGNLYVEQLYGRYGVRPSDGIAQRSIYLGRGEFEVYSKGIYQSAPADGLADGNPSATASATNPFGAIGSRYGSAYASGESFLVNFEAKEPGYLFVMATLVPRVTYSSGLRRYLRHYIGDGSLSDMANPILQNVGPQPIYEYELNGAYASNGSDAIFGFTDRYGEFKTMEDELHGLMRDGESLEAFALQRSFDFTDAVSINSAFLQIPTDYMDQVTAVKEWISEFGFWLDTYFDYKVAMPINKYSLPSLQDPAYEHGKTIVVSKGGNKL